MATQTRAPTSDEAVSGTWTGSAGSRYTPVDDYPDSAGSDFLTHGTTAGDITFGFSAFTVPTGATISAVRVKYYDRKNAAQGNNVGARLKVNGTYYNASTHNTANGTWTQRTDEWTTNPNTSAAWTVNDVNGSGSNPLQAFGWVSTDANPAIDLSSIEIEVEYVADVSVSLTGQAVTASAGTITASVVSAASILALTACYAVYADEPELESFVPQPIIETVADTEVGLTGASVTVSAGSVVAVVSPALTGESATASAGTLAPAATLALAGESAAASAGTLTPAVSAVLAGSEATASAGTIAATTGVTVALSGGEATTSAGSLTAAISAALSGSEATTSAGTISASVEGEYVPQGVWTLTEDYEPEWAYVSLLTFAPQAQDVTVALTGSSVTASAGTITAETGTVVALTGQEVTVSAGTIAASASDGVVVVVADFPESDFHDPEPTPESETVYPFLTAEYGAGLTGSEVTGQSGTVAPSLTLALTGSEVTASAGTITASEVQEVALTGAAVTSSAGTVGLAVEFALSGAEVEAVAGEIGTEGGTLVEADTPAAGGWFWFRWEQEQQRRKRERREREEREAETERIADETAREIAQILRDHEARDNRRHELERLSGLVDAYQARTGDASLSPKVIRAIEQAAERKTKWALLELERELNRARAEEEAFLMEALRIALDYD